MKKYFTSREKNSTKPFLKAAKYTYINKNWSALTALLPFGCSAAFPNIIEHVRWLIASVLTRRHYCRCLVIGFTRCLPSQRSRQTECGRTERAFCFPPLLEAHPRSYAKAKRELSLVRRPTFSFLSLLRGRFVQYIKKFLYKVFSSLLSPLSTFGLTCEFPFLPVAVLTKSCLSLLMRHSHLSLHNKLPTVLLQCTYLISETILAVKTDKFVIRIQFDSIRLAI